MDGELYLFFPFLWFSSSSPSFSLISFSFFFPFFRTYEIDPRALLSSPQQHRSPPFLFSISVLLLFFCGGLKDAAEDERGWSLGIRVSIVTKERKER